MKYSLRSLSVALVLFTAAAAQTAAPSRSPDVIFVPTPLPVVEEMLRLAEVSKDDLVYDLGCGDGRLVVTAAKKYGARGVGIDIDPVRIKESRANAEAAGVTSRVKFLNQDLFESDFHDATAVTLYLLTSLNIKLRPILLDQLKPGTPIVSHDFDMGDWEPEQEKEVKGPSRVHRIYRWTVPAKAAGNWQLKVGPKDSPYELALKQNYNKISGKVRANGRDYTVLNGVVHGTQLSMELSGGGGRFEGIVNDASLTGRITRGGTTLTATGTRIQNGTLAALQ